MFVSIWLSILCKIKQKLNISLLITSVQSIVFLLIIKSRHFHIHFFLQVLHLLDFHFALEFRKHYQRFVLRLFLRRCESLLLDILLQLALEVFVIVVVLQFTFEIIITIIHLNFLVWSPLHFHGSFNLSCGLLLICKRWCRASGVFFCQGLWLYGTFDWLSDDIFGN